MVYLLASAAETRSRETAKHVHRVGLLAEMLARNTGLDAALCEQLRHAAPLHDIGKIGIPDPILNKRRAHTEREYMREQSGRKFDPLLVDCLFAYWDEAIEIRCRHPDQDSS